MVTVPANGRAVPGAAPPKASKTPLMLPLLDLADAEAGLEHPAVMTITAGRTAMGTFIGPA